MHHGAGADSSSRHNDDVTLVDLDTVACKDRSATGSNDNIMDHVADPLKTDEEATGATASAIFPESHNSQFSDSRHPHSADQHPRTLLEEIREVLAQSYLIFLVADLRLMSGTGRICTVYEHLAIDSDVYPKNTAAQLACMVLPSNEQKEEETAEETVSSHDTDKSTMVASWPEQPTKSLSPANIMAILLLEIRDTFVNAVGSDENPEVGQALMSYREDKAKRRDLEDSMTSLLRAYARMISEDLVTEIPYVRRRRMMTSSGTGPWPFPTTTSAESLVLGSTQDHYPQLHSSSQVLSSIREETGREFKCNTTGSRKDLTVDKKIETVDKYPRPTAQSSKHVSVASDHAASIGQKVKLPEARENTCDGSEVTKAKSEDSLQPDDLPEARENTCDGSEVTKAKSEDSLQQDNLPEARENTSDCSKVTKAKSEDSLQPDDLRIDSVDSSTVVKKPPSQGKKDPIKRPLVSSPQNPFSSARREQLVNQVSQRRDQLAEEAKQFAANIKHKRQSMVQEINDRVDPNREGNVQKEFQELTHALFEEGEENKQVVSSLGGNVAQGEMLNVMRRAVDTRDDGQLRFLSRLFKDGSVSQLLVESHSRLVWMNDWYPLKDLTYAIAVDTHLKRVLVVFRGAITAQDWRTVMHYSMETIPNPVQEEYEGRKDKIRVFSGFYEYLFRVRKDTGTTKYSEIASLAHKYGMEKIGNDYKLFVTGHSLGGALTNFFCFFASTEERFTRNGPVRAIAFAGPYCGGHSFADSFRHQERKKKLQFIRVANNNDMVHRLPMNFRIGRRGCRWRHVGIGVTMPTVPLFGKWKPLIHYYGKEKSWFGSTVHGYTRNFLFHTPFLRPWTIARMHTLFELQDRLMYGEMLSNPGGDFTMLNQTMDELYKGLAEEDFQKLKGTKTKQKWR
ncbi:lipase class 3 [Nitzschia inconspicua]|uniref:Lipase class 3 n=1 Tax=Nitzschia inconspicua TaxID=303405 RepID=A0A9K3L597_9STRA|nr:lipase class 3 [Nitzschia inconspicua]